MSKNLVRLIEDEDALDDMEEIQRIRRSPKIKDEEKVKKMKERKK